MHIFKELSKQAQSTAVEGFMEDIRSLFNLKDIKREVVYEFLSKSRVHQYDEFGSLIGKVKSYRN